MTIIQDLDRARRMRGETIEKMCAALGVNRQTWWQWKKTGYTARPKTDNLVNAYIKASSWDTK